MGQHFTLGAGPAQIMGQHVLPRLYGCRRLWDLVAHSFVGRYANKTVKGVPIFGDWKYWRICRVKYYALPPSAYNCAEFRADRSFMQVTELSLKISLTHVGAYML